MSFRNKIKILFLAANPVNTDQLRLGEEVSAIDRELVRARFRDRFVLEQKWAVKAADLSHHLLDVEPHIVHFSGHGSRASQMYLEKPNGMNHPVGVRALSTLFSVLKDNIRCVVLSACYSEKQAMAISRYIDCVIGMSKAIGDKAAVEFAQGFYRGIGFGRDLETAFRLGCAHIDLQGLDEQDTPKILWKDNEPKKIAFAQKKEQTRIEHEEKAGEVVGLVKADASLKLESLYVLGAKCSEAIVVLQGFVEDPSPSNDRKAWKGFTDFVRTVEQFSLEFEIRDEFDELVVIRSTLGRLRRERNRHRKAGRDDLADKAEEVIQRNYVDSINIINEVQEKLP